MKSSVQEDCSEKYDKEYETILNQSANALIPDADESDDLVIKPSEDVTINDESEESVKSPPPVRIEESAVVTNEIPIARMIKRKARSKKSFIDRPKSTTFASAKARASTTKLGYSRPSTGSTSKTKRTASTGNTTIISSAVSPKRMKRAVSTGNSSLSIHQNLYNKSIAQQEEGRRRRQEVELRFSARNIRRHKLRNDQRRESLREEIAKPKKKITIVQAELLYARLISHKARVEDRKITLRRESEEREMQWLHDLSKRKIPLEQATRIYYRGTVNSRSRSRGRFKGL